MDLVDIAKRIMNNEPVLSEKQLQEQRLIVCESCPNKTRFTNQCVLCGCFLDLKVKVLNATCPEGKW